MFVPYICIKLQYCVRKAITQLLRAKRKALGGACIQVNGVFQLPTVVGKRVRSDTHGRPL